MGPRGYAIWSPLMAGGTSRRLVFMTKLLPIRHQRFYNAGNDYIRQANLLKGLSPIDDIRFDAVDALKTTWPKLRLERLNRHLNSHMHWPMQFYS